MVITFIRTLIIFITLIVVMRLMGKRQIGEMQPFEFIITLIIADLACAPMADISIPLVYGLVAILTLFILHQLFSILEQSGRIPKLILSGKPSLILDKNGVNLKELKKNNLGVDDLIESMRSMGYFALDDLDYVVFETNGKMSALPSANKDNKKSGLSIILIDDGKEIPGNLDKIMYTRNDLIEQLKIQGGNIKNTEVMTVDDSGKVYYKAKKQKYKTFNIPLKEVIKW